MELQAEILSESAALWDSKKYLCHSPYSRHQPSSRYWELAECYKKMHGHQFLGALSADVFPGKSFVHEAERIQKLFKQNSVRTMLDYGAGKGLQYSGALKSFQEVDVYQYLGVEEITCFDLGYEPYSQLPSQKFDAVVCTDMLEHAVEEDLPWILHEIFSFANSCVYASVALYPATKTLPNGENAHTLLKPLEWWAAVLKEVTNLYPSIAYNFNFYFTRVTCESIEYKPSLSSH